MKGIGGEKRIRKEEKIIRAKEKDWRGKKWGHDWRRRKN